MMGRDDGIQDSGTPEEGRSPGTPDDDAWERMIAAFRQAAPRGDVPAWLEQRVMNAVEALPKRGPLGRALEWLMSPRPVRISPLMAGLAVAAVGFMLVLPDGSGTPETGGATVATSSAEAVVYVQFMLDAPGATSVAVAGDFSEWEPSFTLEDPDQDGVWSGRVPIRPGVHGYMFLIDGTEWQTDPRADRYRDDGFGNQNAVLAVGTS